jgi:hypothetical protein
VYEIRLQSLEAPSESKDIHKSAEGNGRGNTGRPNPIASEFSSAAAESEHFNRNACFLKAGHQGTVFSQNDVAVDLIERGKEAKES